jgi:hypothetical protein
LTYNTKPYRLSFTAASSLLSDFVRLATLTVENDFKLDKLTNDQIGKEKESTNVRQFRELKHRLKTLTTGEVDILVNGSLVDQKHVALLAICKTYRFISDFIVEVIRDKVLVYDFEIRESDYNSFINRKSFDHPELEGLTESSQTKIKTVLFRMLAEVGLIADAKSKVIQPVLLSDELEKVIVKDNPELLKIFLKSDKEIEALTYVN